MTAEGVRVVKVGGSLFDLPTLPQSIHAWLRQQAPLANVLIAGGGDWANLVRAADRRFSLDETACHWACIDAMSTTARLLAEMLGCGEPVACWSTLRLAVKDASAVAPMVVDCRYFLRSIEPDCPGRALPHGWSVTSDSIAARMGVVLGARELVLLKSALSAASEGDRLRDNTTGGGYVDDEFPRAAQHLARVRCVNLRDSRWPEVEWAVNAAPHRRSNVERRRV